MSESIRGPFSPSSIAGILVRVPSRTHRPPLSEVQSQVDGLIGSAVSTVSDEKMIASLFAAAAAGRFIRLGTVAASGKYLHPLAVQGLPHVTALTGESAVFAGMERKFAAWQGHAPTRSFQKDWARAAINLGSIKLLGGAARGQNLVTQHLLIDLGMVAGHQVGYALGVTDKPQGNFARQMIEAEGMNLSMKGSLTLLHGVSPRLSAMEKSLDLAFASQETGVFSKDSSFPFFLHLARATAGGPEAFSASSRKPEVVKGPSMVLAEGLKEKKGSGLDANLPSGDSAGKLSLNKPERLPEPSREPVPLRDKLTKIGQISPPLIIGMQWLLNGHPTGAGFLGAIGVGILSMAFSRGGFNTGIAEALWSRFWYRFSQMGQMHCWGDPFYGWWNSKLIAEEMTWLRKNKIPDSERVAMRQAKALRKAAKEHGIDLELYLSRALQHAEPAELEAGLKLLFKNDYSAKADFIARHQIAAGAKYLEDLAKTIHRAPYNTNHEFLETIEKLIAFDRGGPYFADLERIAMSDDPYLGNSLRAAKILSKAGQKEQALPYLRRFMTEGNARAALILAENGYASEAESFFLGQITEGKLGIEGLCFLGERGHREVISEIRRLLESERTYDSDKTRLLILLGDLGERAEAIQGAERLKKPSDRAEVLSKLGETHRAAELAVQILNENLGKEVDRLDYFGFDNFRRSLGILGRSQAAEHIPIVLKFVQDPKGHPAIRLWAARALIDLNRAEKAQGVLKGLLREKDYSVEAGSLLDRIEEGWDYFIPGSPAFTRATAYRGRIASPPRGLTSAGDAKIRFAGKDEDILAELEADASQEVEGAPTEARERNSR